MSERREIRPGVTLTILTPTREWGGPTPPQEPIATKVAHVRASVASEPEHRYHTCHWPGCTRQVHPSRWGCPPHWMRLPKHLQNAVWNAYRVGQEKTLTPSAEYLEVADKVQRWIEENYL